MAEAMPLSDGPGAGAAAVEGESGEVGEEQPAIERMSSAGARPSHRVRTAGLTGWIGDR